MKKYIYSDILKVLRYLKTILSTTKYWDTIADLSIIDNVFEIILCNQFSNYIVTFLPFKNVKIYEFVDCK